jgi:hypothetical protein
VNVLLPCRWLLNDAVTNETASDDRMIKLIMNWEGFGRKRPWSKGSTFQDLPGITKTTKSLRQDRMCPGRDSNRKSRALHICAVRMTWTQILSTLSLLHSYMNKLKLPYRLIKLYCYNILHIPSCSGSLVIHHQTETKENLRMDVTFLFHILQRNYRDKNCIFLGRSITVNNFRKIK